jgi:hypothetical protein
MLQCKMQTIFFFLSCKRFPNWRTHHWKETHYPNACNLFNVTASKTKAIGLEPLCMKAQGKNISKTYVQVSPIHEDLSNWTTLNEDFKKM